MEFVAAIQDGQKDSQKQVAEYLRFFLKSPPEWLRTAE